MCRMSMLVARERYSLTQTEIQNQLAHVKSMSQGNNTVPFRYGHLTNSEEYAPEQKLIHGDGFGVYLHSAQLDAMKKYTRAVSSVNQKNVVQDLPYRLEVSLMHARLVTQGSKDLPNIQPFDLSAIVGSHNGTVSGIQEGSKSDSMYILETLDQHIGAQSQNIDVAGLEQVMVKQIAQKCSEYSAMNMIIYAKTSGKILVLCSYNETKVISPEHAQYYRMVISVSGKTVYIASETDHGKVVRAGNIIHTKNHTLYIIDKKTGKVEEFHLAELEKAVKDTNTKAKQHAEGQTEHGQVKEHAKEETAQEAANGKRIAAETTEEKSGEDHAEHGEEEQHGQIEEEGKGSADEQIPAANAA